MLIINKVNLMDDITPRNARLNEKNLFETLNAQRKEYQKKIDNRRAFGRRYNSQELRRYIDDILQLENHFKTYEDLTQRLKELGSPYSAQMLSIILNDLHQEKDSYQAMYQVTVKTEQRISEIQCDTHQYCRNIEKEVENEIKFFEAYRDIFRNFKGR